MAAEYQYRKTKQAPGDITEVNTAFILHFLDKSFQTFINFPSVFFQPWYSTCSSTVRVEVTGFPQGCSTLIDRTFSFDGKIQFQ